MELPKYFYFRVKYNPRGTSVTLEDASDVDVVEVVRCRDCVYFEASKDYTPYCNHINGLDAVVADAYCSYGERKGLN